MKFLCGAHLLRFRGYECKLLEIPAAPVRVVSQIPTLFCVGGHHGSNLPALVIVPVAHMCGVRAAQKRCDVLHLSENRE